MKVKLAGGGVWGAFARLLLLGAVGIGPAGSASADEFATEDGQAASGPLFPPPGGRRMGRPRRDPPDRLDRPREAERSTHRGWEVHRDQFTVVAGTTREEALFAADQFQAAWNETRRLLDPWTGVHRHPDFGLGAAEITIDNRPSRPRHDQDSTLMAHGVQMIVYVNVAPGQPSLQEQLATLRMGAAVSLLHAAHLDQQLPGWVVQGMAAYVAEKQEESSGTPRSKIEPLAALDTDYWKRPRVDRRRLAERTDGGIEPSEQVRFLLEAEDGRHAPEFFAALRATVEQAEPGANLQMRSRPRPPSDEAPSTPIDELLARRASELDSWRRNPRAGQPLLTPLENADPELRNAQREVAFVLKLAERASPTRGAAGNVGSASGDDASRPKVTEFVGGAPRTVTPPSAVGTPLSAERPATEFAPASMSSRRLYERLSTPSRTWATLDPQGRVLLSTDRQRLRELLGVDDARTSLTTVDSRTVVRTTLEDGRRLEGWLEENPEQPSRPIARFALVSSGASAR